MSDRRQIVIFAAAAICFCVLASYAVNRCFRPFSVQLTPLEMKGAWISAGEVGGYAVDFRKTVNLSSPVSNAWVAIAACDSFEIIVNGDTAGRQFLWRPTRPFQNGLSEDGQKLGYTLPMLGLNYPREYQWTGHRSDLLPVFIDIGPFLKPGRNSICIEVESRSLQPKMKLDGEVLLKSGERINLATGSGWKAEEIPPDGSLTDWASRDYVDIDWADAVTVAAPGGQPLKAFDPRLFSEPFAGGWTRASTAVRNRPVVFEQTWTLSSKPVDGWIRIIANRNYDLFINGRRVNSAAKPNLDGGEWIIDTQKVADPPMMPELLDPDEVESTFVGTSFEKPPHSDPTANDFHPFKNTLNRTHDRPDATSPGAMPGDLDPRKEHGGESQPFDPSTYAPGQRTPKALTRNRQAGSFNLYDVRWMLQSGTNTISVRLIPSDSVEPLNWQAQFSMDGMARFADGRDESLPSAGWTWREQLRNEVLTAPQEADTGGPAFAGEGGVLKKNYRGAMSDASVKLRSWLFTAVTITSAAVLAFLVYVRRFAGAWRQRLGDLTAILLAPITVLLAAFLVEAAWGERHESMFFRQQSTWLLVFFSAFGAAILAAAWLAGRSGFFSRASRVFGRRLRSFPGSAAWKCLIVLILLVCAFLRAYKIDQQPLDDDEYASVQAVFAIADHGVPRYTEDVYYTRSPLYHYLTGGIVAIFGKNLWAVRLPGVAFAVATALLIYLCGARILGNRWIGLAGLILYTIHPYTIYSAHIGRFYQQQQFFALLTIYWFCRGMVTEQSMRCRYLMLAALLGAILSQELSLVLMIPIGLGYILFAERKSWAEEISFFLAGGCVLALTAVDLAVFQTVCLTRVEGVSPNIEPTLKPNFFYPMNFFTMLIAYSRLHLALSILLVAGFPFAIRERHRGVVALYFVLVAGVVSTVLLVTSGSLRYQYWLIPIWMLLGLQSTKSLLDFLLRLPAGETPGRHGWLRSSLAAILFGAVVLSFSPWRISGSYDAKLLPDSTSAFRYVGSQLRPGDAVVATEPHPHAALLEAGRVDYDLSIPLLYDFAYKDGERLIDRNGGAEVVGSLKQLQKVCATHNRVWVVVNREKFRSRGRNIRWEYPGARVELFLRQNCKVMFRGALWTVYLWDAGNGTWRNFAMDGGTGPVE